MHYSQISEAIPDGVEVSLTFCELTARFRCAKSDCGSTVPKKMDLYWFIPAFVNSRVGSESGTTEEDGTAQKVSC
jgi:hypothetical protein